MWDYYRNNPQALAQLRAPIYEEKVVDFIIELANVTDKPMSREELVKQEEADSASASVTWRKPDRLAPQAQIAYVAENPPRTGGFSFGNINRAINRFCDFTPNQVQPARMALAVRV